MRQKALHLLFLANHILLIIYMSWLAGNSQLEIESITPFLIVSLFLIDITYISSCNIRANKVISLFCGVLILDCWYMLLLLDTRDIANFVFSAISPIMWYVFIQFILMFLFQGSEYRFRKAVHIVLSAACVCTLISLPISERAFACMYAVQYLSNILCFLFVVVCHRKRVVFVLKSEWKYLAVSASIVTVTFFAYYFATLGIRYHISNFGIYLPVLLFFLSIHSIIWREHNHIPLSTVFGKSQLIIITCSSLSVIGLVILFLGAGYEELLISANILFAIFYLCNILWEQNLKRGESSIARESKYHAALQQLQHEEMLKSEFANYLHDDILQNLLSIKNLMGKVDRPEIQKLVVETLDSLNADIREQMQDYHPVILKNLTSKENLQNHIEAVSQSFHQRRITCSFDCPDSLFLVEPYDILICRIMKELLTNIFKHSAGNRAWVTLSQKKDIICLTVSDNGVADASALTNIDDTKHKGIVSIREQVGSMEGTLIISNNLPHGICIKIEIPMKGDVSYQHFIS